MPKPTKGPRLGGSPSHQRIILANLASQLYEHGRITTTETKAKRVQPLAEHLITKAKRGDLHSRRIVMKTITNPDIVHILFTEIAPQMAEREGGYTRITKLGTRKGDGAPMALIELVTEPVAAKPKSKKAAKPKAKATPAKDEDAPTEDAAPEAEAVADDAAEAVDESTEAAADDAAEPVADAADEAEAE